ncbi:hypothetical protein H9L12_08035 [Sphingomonas rhizophila]|uniref:Uncharacterized protein n=1 Tax=Sphingomonas rhizophila TaxID=2071607 RepID=A0A7G9S8X2_9SPHN|nr:hypothetical protein [Sphingomonas rhizophila]QNN64297.1 hypothetical protein H9L12_08035 [Sphingomonas rhizophila]
MKGKMLFAAALLSASSTVHAAPPEPLFAADQPLALEIRGAIQKMMRGDRDRSDSVPGTVTVKSTGESLPVTLGLRGITRMRKETCQFPPLRVSFTNPAPTSVFARQGRLKLVTHCRNAQDFQQHVLLEYAAYRLYNLLTPVSFRARLATIDYVDDAGKPITSRVGFFIEDDGSAARRNGLRKARVGQRVPTRQIDPAAAARMVLFEYMIGNLDWALQAGPAGEPCCHNGRLVQPAVAGQGLIPMPYDFDYSGLVDAPYAVPPEGFTEASVRERRYRGYCIHNDAVLAAAGDFRARRGAFLAELNAVPGLDRRRAAKASAYLEEFFALIATDQSVRARVINRCLKV